jgi:beta-lactamase class A
VAVNHDSGIVFLPDGRKYVIVMLSKGIESEEVSTELLSNVSRIVYEYVIAK